ncbi:MAG: bifunctional tetrahydrofolate synthase/dihydrofolate synthase [Chromatiales bacterium]|nr:bifunctional tetrahydrofolate synthase/dihydrofolate synthase [Chromatiales bacterium]
MSARSIDEWLSLLESLDPATIVMGLERVAEVAGRLELETPHGAVFTVAGTNGKGSTACMLENLLAARGRRTGLYTSPHLVRYHERMRIAGAEISDARLLSAFAAVEQARGETPLTYFEFGTLAALQAFSEAGCDAWVLEVGMGGRLDAVNLVDPDFSLITTIALDHQQWLGDDIESIAAEKAGILRPGAPAYYGDTPVPLAISTRARALGAPLACLKRDFGAGRVGDSFRFELRGQALGPLPCPLDWGDAQLRNAALALAAFTDWCRQPLPDPGDLAGLSGAVLPGRLQRIQREHEWILDVAHNPQAVAALLERIARLPEAARTSLVVGMLDDKDIEGCIALLAPLVDTVVTCRPEDGRAAGTGRLAAALDRAGRSAAADCASVGDALARARELTAPGGRIIVTGSFRIVGPALAWLGSS